MPNFVSVPIYNGIPDYSALVSYGLYLFNVSNTDIYILSSGNGVYVALNHFTNETYGITIIFHDGNLRAWENYTISGHNTARERTPLNGGEQYNWIYIASNTINYEEPRILNSAFDGYFTSRESLVAAALELVPSYPSVPITYRLTNATTTGPSEATVGDTVTVPLVFPSNYGVVNSSNAYVTNNGVVIPSSYSNGVLTFTMPNPS